MTLVAITFSLVLVLFVVLGFGKKEGKSGWMMSRKQLLCLLPLIILVFGSYAVIPTGHTGIVVTFGNVEDTTLEAGLHFKMPYQDVVVMDNRAQKKVIEMSCFSSDIQDVSVTYSLNYQIKKENAQNIYRTIGVDYYNIVMEPRVQEAVKSVIAKYSAENLISSREDISRQIYDILDKELEAYNILVINTAVENLDFSDAFTDAVEDKQVAEQQKLKAQIEQEQLNLEATASAERDVIAAQADAEVTKIQAEVAEYAGEKEAEVNRKLAGTLTETLVKYYYSQKWDGKLPEIVGSDTVLPILGDLGGTSANEAEG